MEEAEWLTSNNPQEMLTCFQNTLGLKAQFPRPSDRKLRLFGVACCRRVWHLFGEPGRRAVEVAERHADDQATLTEVMTACKTAIDTAGWVDPSDAAGRRPYSAASRNMFLAVWPVSHPDILPRDTLAFIHNTVPGSANLLREILGNPFQPAIPIWELMSWRTPTVLALSQAAYEERVSRRCATCGGSGKIVVPDPPGVHTSFRANTIPCKYCKKGRIEDGALDNDRLAVLADALEEAGCQDEAILRHLRGQERCINLLLEKFSEKECELCHRTGWMPLRGHHVRGCHVLDTILGKE